MFFQVLATDYDGTLAAEGLTDAATLAALVRLREAGRRVLLVTGRELPDLRTVFDRFDLFDVVVAENGGLLYWPHDQRELPLAPPPPEAFIERLRAAGVPLSVGRTIVATRVPHDREVQEAVRDLGLDLKITYNKGAVMVLPNAVTKASGLFAVLRELSLSPLNVVGIGDAENDQAFLAMCGCGIAVANALPSVKKEVDWITVGARGAGVQEAVTRMIATDLADVPLPRLSNIVVGLGADGRQHTVPWRGQRVLIAGTSGGGKTTALTALIEQLRDRALQTVVLDPEGEYEGLYDLVSLGDAQLPPALTTLSQLLADPQKSVALDLLAVQIGDRPDFLAKLVAQLDEVRRTTGRPHWLVLDEAHHLLPAARGDATFALPRHDMGQVFVTLEPHRLAQEVLEGLDVVVAVSDTAGDVIREVAAARKVPAPSLPPGKLERGEAFLWRTNEQTAERVTIPPSEEHHRRHVRKYVEGHLAPEGSFYFR